MRSFFTKKIIVLELFSSFIFVSFSQIPSNPGLPNNSDPGNQGGKILDRTMLLKRNNITQEDFRILSDDPEGLRILAFDIPLYSMKFSTMETSWYEMRLGMSYLGKGKLNGGFSHKTAFKTMNQSSYTFFKDIEVSPIEPIKFSTEYEGYLNFFLYEKLDEKDEGIIVNNKKGVITYAVVKMHNLKKFGLSLGAFGGKMKYDLDKMVLNLISVDQPSTTINESFFTQYTVQNYFVLKAGVVFNRLTDTEIHTNQYGKKNGSTSWLISANLLYAAKNTFQDVNVDKNNQITRYKIDNPLMKKNNVGFEVGAKYSLRGNTTSIDAKYRYHPGFSKLFGGTFLLTVSYQIDFFHIKEFESPF